VMGIRLIIEGDDFKISAFAIQALCFFEGSIGLKPERSESEFSCDPSQGFQNSLTDTEPARIYRDPHALDFADASIFRFDDRRGAR